MKLCGGAASLLLDSKILSPVAMAQAGEWRATDQDRNDYLSNNTTVTRRTPHTQDSKVKKLDRAQLWLARVFSGSRQSASPTCMYSVQVVRTLLMSCEKLAMTSTRMPAHARREAP